MSYRQLARMAPTTLSVHWVLAIYVKTHFAKDLLVRYLLARLMGQQKARDLEALHRPLSNAVELRSAAPWGKALTRPLPIYLVQSDAPLIIIIQIS